MNTNNCLLCGTKINCWSYSNAVYCSSYCRKRSYDIRKGRSQAKSHKKGFESVGQERLE